MSGSAISTSEIDARREAALTATAYKDNTGVPADDVIYVSAEDNPKFVLERAAGHLTFVRLDEGVKRVDAGGLPFGGVGDARVGNVPWSARPTVLVPATTTGGSSTGADPGRFCDGADSAPALAAEPRVMVPRGASDAVPAIPTHHFAAWTTTSAASLDLAAGRDLGPFLCKRIVCTGPFVASLEPDNGSGAMKAVVTPATEAQVTYYETTVGTELRYTDNQNGAAFAANPGHPWSVCELTPTTAVLFSSRGGDAARSDRYLFFNRGVCSFVYSGDADGIIKNVTSRADAPGNRNNQFGHGSVGPSAHRRWIREWDSAAAEEDPVPVDATEFRTAPRNVPNTTTAVSAAGAGDFSLPEFLRLDQLSGLVAFAQYPGEITGAMFDSANWVAITGPASGTTAGSGIDYIDMPTTTAAAPAAFIDESAFAATFVAGAPTAIDFAAGFAGTTFGANVAADVPFAPLAITAVTYLLAPLAAVDAAAGVTAVDAVAAISVRLNTLLNATSTQVTVEVANLWFSPRSGRAASGLTPLVPEPQGFASLEEAGVPDVADSGALTGSASARDFVFGPPLNHYGTTIIKPVGGASSASIAAHLGVRRITHDFVGTDETRVAVNFRAATADTVAPPGNGIARILFWDPVMDGSGPPEVITPERPAGYRVVDFGAARAAETGVDNTSEHVYTRYSPVVVHAAAAESGSTFARARNTDGDPVVENTDALAVAAALDAEFSTADATTDSVLWNGEPLIPGDTPITGSVSSAEAPWPARRVHADPLAWGRRVYRYARYLEAAARGARPPYTDTMYGGTAGAGDTIAARVSDGALRLWLGVREVIVNGLVPEYPALALSVRDVAAGDPIGTSTNFTGMDVAYAGPSGEESLTLVNTPAPVESALSFAGAADAPAAAIRLATAPYGSIATIADLAEVDTDARDDIVDLDAADTSLDPHERLSRAVLDRAVRLAALNSTRGGARPNAPDFRFADVLAEFGRFAYDRGMSEDATRSRSLWGGFTNRVGHETERWGVVCDAGGVPDVTGAALPASGAIPVIPLARVRPNAVLADDASFPPPPAGPEGGKGFSFYANHHRAAGYILYAAAVALRYGGAVSHSFPGAAAPRTLYEDAAHLFTAAGQAGAEPMPLMQLFLDVAAPPVWRDVLFAVGGTVDDVPRRNIGVYAPREAGAQTDSQRAAAQRAVRAFPAHRHFDPYLSVSWEPGVKPGRTANGAIARAGCTEATTQTAEGRGEAALCYLAAFRLASEVVRYERGRATLPLDPAATTESTRRLSDYYTGYLAETRRYFPVTAFALLNGEAAHARFAARPTRGVASACLRAQAETHGAGATVAGIISGSGSGSRGFPVAAATSFMATRLQILHPRTTELGVAFACDHTLDHTRSRSHSAKAILEAGAGTVPLSDVTAAMAAPEWPNMAGGLNIAREGIAYVDDSRIHDFGGVLHTPVGGTAPVTIPRWANERLTLYAAATPATVATGVAPTLAVQQWARQVLPALNVVADPEGAPGGGAVGYPTDPEGYLPQSSWHAVLFWYRARGTDDPVPDVADPVP